MRPYARTVLTVAVLGRVEVRRDGVPAVVPGGLTDLLAGFRSEDATAGVHERRSQVS
jgi:hypothetical protein